MADVANSRSLNLPPKQSQLFDRVSLTNMRRGLGEMNMKRGLVLSLCTAVLVATASPALAVVSVQLNLRYNDPGVATSGGTWDLLVKSTASLGLAGIAVTVGGNLGVTGTDTPLAAITPNAAVFNNTDQVFRFQGSTTNATFNTVNYPNGFAHIVAGDDLAGTLRLQVGTPTSPSLVVQDDLFNRTPFPTNDFWDNSTRIASGSWAVGTARPTMVLGAVAANEFAPDGPDAGTDPDVVAATFDRVSVRGDSVGVDGLRPGDANRDGIVGAADVSILAANFGLLGARTWDQADFVPNTGPSEVGAADVSALAANFNPPNPPTPNPLATAIPEPSGIALLGLALLGLACRGRRA